MELNTLADLIRSDEPVDPSPGTVDRLVTGALRQGRRTRIGRRVAVGLAGGALLVSGAAVVGQWPGGPVEVAPAAPAATATASVTPEPSESPTPSESDRPVSRAIKPPTQREVLSVLKSGLPPGFEVGQARLKDASPESGVSTSFVVTDEAGRAFIGGGVDRADTEVECDPGTCTREELAGGTVLVLRSPEGEKTGDGTWYYFQRPDGGWVWIGQDNALDGGSRPVSRPELPLTHAQVRSMLTAPGWDPLVARCTVAGPAC